MKKLIIASVIASVFIGSGAFADWHGDSTYTKVDEGTIHSSSKFTHTSTTVAVCGFKVTAPVSNELTFNVNGENFWDNNDSSIKVSARSNVDVHFMLGHEPSVVKKPAGAKDEYFDYRFTDDVSGKLDYDFPNVEVSVLNSTKTTQLDFGVLPYYGTPKHLAPVGEYQIDTILTMTCSQTMEQ